MPLEAGLAIHHINLHERFDTMALKDKIYREREMGWLGWKSIIKDFVFIAKE